MAYIGSSPTKVVSRQSANIFTYTATANQTAFTGADANGNTLACSPSDLMVHMNGIKLEESDYTATTTTVTLGSGAAAGDEVTITAFLTFESADHYNKSTSDTRYVNATGDNITGSLGINNATPSFPLHIKGSTNTNAILGVESANWTTGATAELRLAYTAGYNRSIKGHHDNGLQFFTNPTNPSLQIDNSGRVTMPNQPSFAAAVSANNWTTSSAADCPFDNELFDIGGHYNSSNYTFTAPVAGRYFTSFFLNRYTDSRFDIAFMVNGTARHGLEVREAGAGQWHMESAQVILNLAANDAVKMRITSVTTVGTAIFDGGGSYYDVFSMHLLG